MFWRLNKFNLLFLADIKDDWNDWFLSLRSLLESPFFATCAGWARPRNVALPAHRGTSLRMRCSSRGGRQHPSFGGWLSRENDGDISDFSPRTQGHVQFKWFTQERCNFKWFLTKNNCDLGDFTEYGDFTKLQGIGNHGNKFWFLCCIIQLLGQSSFDPCPLSSNKWSQFLESN